MFIGVGDRWSRRDGGHKLINVAKILKINNNIKPKNKMRSLLQLACAAMAITLALASCTMEKRVYTPGYHIEWNKSKYNVAKQEFGNTDNQKQTEQKQIVTVEQPIDQNDIIDNAPPVTNDCITASLGNSMVPMSAPAAQLNEFAADTALKECDNITLRNGGEISAKVLEISTTEVKYKNCDNLNGPTYTIKKSEVFMIKYPNGTKDIIPPSNSASSTKNTSGKKGGEFGIASFVAAILGLFVGAIILGPLAFVFGIIGTINRKLKGLAIAGLIIGFIDTVLILIVLGTLL